MRCHQQQQRATSAPQTDQFPSFCFRNLAPELPRNLLTFISLFTLPDSDFVFLLSLSSVCRLAFTTPQSAMHLTLRSLYPVVPLLVCLVAQCLARFSFRLSLYCSPTRIITSKDQKALQKRRLYQR